MNRMANAVDQECSIDPGEMDSGGAWRDHHEEQPSRRNKPEREQRAKTTLKSPSCPDNEMGWERNKQTAGDHE